MRTEVCLCSFVLYYVIAVHVVFCGRQNIFKDSVDRFRRTAVNKSALDPNLRVKYLRDDLLRNYTKLIRPRLNQSQTVDVYFDVNLRHLVRVDIQKTKVELLVCLWQQWTDHGLRWDHKFYKGKFVEFDPNDIWIPDTSFINSIYTFGHLTKTTILPVRVNWSGSVLWQLLLVRTVRCKMEARLFPYDSQTCFLELGSFNMRQSQINLELMPNKRKRDQIELNQFSHQEWELLHISKTKLLKNVSGVEKPVLRFEYLFRRRPDYFEQTLIYPTVLTTLMTFVSFNLPHICGEKVVFSASVLLALVLNIRSISIYVPHSSDDIPVLIQFLFTSICIVTISVIQDVLLIFVCYSSEIPDQPTSIVESSIFQQLAKATLSLNDNSVSVAKRQSPRVSRGCPVNRKRKIFSEEDNLDEDFNKMMRSVVSSAKFWVTQAQKAETVSQAKRDWRVIAQVADRVLSFIFFIVLVTFCIIFKRTLVVNQKTVVPDGLEDYAYDYYK